MTKGKSYHRRIIDILADGQPHRFTDILKAVGRFVAPETADKEYRKRHTKWKQDKLAVRVSGGRARLVWLSLNSAVHHAKTVVPRGRGAERTFRLTKAALKRYAKKTETTTETPTT